MTCLAQLQKFLFTHARRVDAGGAPNPDGRPLYAYRCSARAYDELCSQVANHFRQATYGHEPPGFAACFCLFASETFHREHIGGSWTWKTVFEPLKASVPAHQTIARWVEQGLVFWKRPIVKGTQGQRLLLVSIACEGGLPLRLLQREGAHLRTFFRQILEDHHATGGLLRNIETLVRHNIHRLPQSLRTEEVVQLAAALIGKTVELQDLIGGYDNPIAALDKQVPNWRSTLPLRLDDEVASALFENLVKDSREIALAAAAQPTWKGRLVEQTPGHFVVRKSLQFPEVLPENQVSAWMGYQDRAPARLRLYLNTLHRNEPIAILTLFDRSAGIPVYRREWVRPGGVILRGSEVLEPRQVCLGHNADQREMAVKHSAEWGECPWVFVRANEESQWNWLCEGSGKTQSDQALIVTPAHCAPAPSVEGSFEHIGNTLELERAVYRISGTVDFQTEAGDRYRFQCSAGGDSTGSLELRGFSLRRTLNSQPVFLGVPRFREESSGRVVSQTNMGMQWRPYGHSVSWCSAVEGCVGRVWLRLIDPSSGVERIRRRADILPSRFTAERQIGVHQRAGQYRFRGVANAAVEVLEPASAKTTLLQEEDAALIHCPPINAESRVPLTAQLHWPGTAPVTLRMPYPQKGAVFQLDGRTLRSNELVTLDRLYGLWLVLQNPYGGERFILDAELAGKNSVSHLGFIERLPPLEGGVLERNLGAWVSQVQSMLAASDDLEAAVILTVQSQARENLARVRVSHFDMVVYPFQDDESVLLPVEQLEKLGEDWPSRISMEMFRLWSPNDRSLSLENREGMAGVWRVPGQLEPGPWWVVGRDAGWTRFRPLLWPVAASAETAEKRAGAPGLAGAVREINPETRSERIDSVIRELGESPEHSDWQLLFSYVALTKEFPPNSLDLLRHVIRHPRTLALALFLSDEVQFERLIGFAEQMPFAWELLPVSEWRHAAHIYFTYLRKALADLEAAEDIIWGVFKEFRDRAMTAYPYFDPLCDWIQEMEFPTRTLADSSLRLARQLPMAFHLGLLVTAEEGLLSRHDPDEFWPQGSKVIELVDNGAIRQEFQYANLTQIQRPVRCAPFVAASIATGTRDDSVSRARLVYELRSLRGFDSEWFDYAYAVALALGLTEYQLEEFA